ncbi:MAG: ATP-binding protein [Candidatus Nanogingivalis sp.]
MFNIFSKKENLTQKNAGEWGDGRAVLSAISDGVMALDSSGNIRIINSSAEKILGWSSGDSSNLSFESVFILVDKDGRVFERESNPIRRALLSFENFSSRELSLKTQSGKTFPISLQINAIDEQRSGLVVVFRNITKEIEENRQQTEFISTASHEMRTPVASIEGYLGLSLNPATATIDDRAREFLEKAYDNTRHLGQLFQDLLDISKSEDGRLKNEPVVLDAVEFSRKIWDGLREKAAAKNLDFVFDLDSKKTGEKILTPVYYVHSDRDHLHEVLDNLFENAIKYTPSGRVSVNVSGDNENVRISVTDSGIGIPAEDIPHLFQKFYRVDNTETREIGGTGLGLYLSRRLVESMGGKLLLESEYKKGSIFTVQLPRLTREQADSLKSQETTKEETVDSKDNIFEDSKEIFASKMEQDLSKKEEKTSEIKEEREPESSQNQPQIQPQPQVQFENPPQIQPEFQQNQNIPQQPQPQTVQQIQESHAQYAAQEKAIREYQMQQYYARQKAAEDARIRAEQANLARAQQQLQQAQAQNPYFPQNQQVSNFGSISNYFPPAPPQFSNLSGANQAFQSQSVQPTQPTLSDIEKMREQYVQRMMAERQNSQNN